MQCDRFRGTDTSPKGRTAFEFTISRAAIFRGTSIGRQGYIKGFADHAFVYARTQVDDLDPLVLEGTDADQGKHRNACIAARSRFPNVSSTVTVMREPPASITTLRVPRPMSPAARKPHTFTAGSSSRATRNFQAPKNVYPMEQEAPDGPPRLCGGKCLRHYALSH